MGFNGRAQRLLIVVWDIMPICYRADNRAYLRIMNAAYFRKQMMLNLVVESPDIPAKQFIIVSKIRGSFQLVNHPGVFDISLFVFCGMFGTLYDVSKLKNYT